ncbi:MAG: RNA polymerase sigma factor [Candidatus Marinimicrobia bacterium]|nr:RNA polymerase sigma factor [Candidatus Neomarinimicrobiota bacterium]
MVDDLKLIERFKQGDESAFNELVLNHKDWVLNFVLQLSYNKEDAQDLAQEVFVKVYFNIRKFRGDAKFNTWLYKIVVNQMNSYFKKQKLLSWFQHDYEDQIDHASDEPNSSKDRNRLIQSVKLLAKMQRNVVLLRVFQDMTFKEVSEVLSISENSAKVSFYKAKQNLKGLINGYK